MARLNMVKPIVARGQSRLVSAGPDERSRDRLREKLKPWRKWYRLARWSELRSAVLRRDEWTCQQTGVLLIGKHPAPNSPVVDHIRPHRGDPALFWDEANLQTVSKAWHDSEKQRRERAGIE